jgi:hypothetical protein
MPRGTCENCGQHDVFVHASPVALGTNVFVCVRCISLPHELYEDEDDESDECDEDENENNEREPRGSVRALLGWNFRL